MSGILAVNANVSGRQWVLDFEIIAFVSPTYKGYIWGSLGYTNPYDPPTPPYGTFVLQCYHFSTDNTYNLGFQDNVYPQTKYIDLWSDGVLLGAMAPVPGDAKEFKLTANPVWVSNGATYPVRLVGHM